MKRETFQFCLVGWKAHAVREKTLRGQKRTGCRGEEGRTKVAAGCCAGLWGAGPPAFPGCGLLQLKHRGEKSGVGMMGVLTGRWASAAQI